MKPTLNQLLNEDWLARGDPYVRQIHKNLGWASGPDAHWRRVGEAPADQRTHKLSEPELAEFRAYQRKFLSAYFKVGPKELQDARDRLVADGVNLPQAGEITPEVAEQRVQEYLDRVAGGDLSVRRSIKTSEAILDPESPTSGTFLSQFTAHTSSGTLDTGARSRAELNGLGVPLGTDPFSRPVYGFLDRPEVGRDMLENYGKVEFVLNDNVKARSTMTVGDSLAAFELSEVKGTPIADPGIEGISGMNMVSVAKRGDGSIGYIEAQIQGEVHLADVKTIRVPRETLMPGMEPDTRTDRIISLATAAKIPVEVYDPNADAAQRAKDKP